AQVLRPPTDTGMWAGFDPEILGQAGLPHEPAISLAIDRAVRDALSAGLTLRETYQQVRTTLISQGVRPDGVDIDRCVKDYALGAI
ncbi:MAG TPA: hypothetical protein VHG52_00280, partial [Thermomicrobiales bacterium]|nr:hypothetical protein [Thermomicrobiales bacterium]